jgi:hypothetical protein
MSNSNATHYNTSAAQHSGHTSRTSMAHYFTKFMAVGNLRRGPAIGSPTPSSFFAFPRSASYLQPHLICTEARTSWRTDTRSGKKITMIEVIYIVRHAVRMKLDLRPHTTLRKTVHHTPQTGQGILSASVAASGSSSHERLAPRTHHRPRAQTKPGVTDRRIGASLRENRSSALLPLECHPF